MPKKTFNLTLIHVDANGDETVVERKVCQKPEFWDDPSDQAARNNALIKKIRGQK